MKQYLIARARPDGSGWDFRSNRGQWGPQEDAIVFGSGAAAELFLKSGGHAQATIIEREKE